MNVKILLMNGRGYGVNATPARANISWPTSRRRLASHTGTAAGFAESHGDDTKLLAQLLAAGAVTRVR